MWLNTRELCILVTSIVSSLIFKTVFAFHSATETPAYWKTLSDQDINEALKLSPNTNTAKNVIVFIGDGMGPTTVTSSRIYGKTEKGFLAFEKFPHIGAIKTYNADKYVPDSCSTATALFSGVKSNYKTGGVDATVPHKDCTSSLRPEAQLTSFIDWAQEAGKSTGLVTTTRVTHATPSALYAHYPERSWECEAKIPPESKACKDIASQLIQDLPGKNMQVIMGGGRQVMQSNVKGNESDPIDIWACYSTDGRDLIKDWQEDKRGRNLTYAYVNNNEELANVDITKTDYLLGIFANGHLKLNWQRDRSPKGMPSLTNMTEKALQVLRKNSKGFVLMVEGGLIDPAHHRGHARQALDETVEFSNAIEKALELTADEAEETLIIVTSDHAHSVVFSGYLDRGKNMLDVAQRSKIDNVGYTALLYGTGGPNNYQFKSINNTVVRPDPYNEDTLSFEYSQQSVVVTDEVTHSGTDVLVYATGPWAHLFHNLHEQTYVAHVVAYAAKIGPYKTLDGEGDGARTVQHSLVLTVVGFLVSLLLCR